MIFFFVSGTTILVLAIIVICILAQIGAIAAPVVTILNKVLNFSIFFVKGMVIVAGVVSAIKAIWLMGQFMIADPEENMEGKGSAMILCIIVAIISWIITKKFILS